MGSILNCSFFLRCMEFCWIGVNGVVVMSTGCLEEAGLQGGGGIQGLVLQGEVWFCSFEFIFVNVFLRFFCIFRNKFFFVGFGFFLGFGINKDFEQIAVCKFESRFLFTLLF